MQSMNQGLATAEAASTCYTEYYTGTIVSGGISYAVELHRTILLPADKQRESKMSA